MHYATGLLAASVLLALLAGCGEDKDNEVPAGSLLAVISTAETDTVPSAVTASLSGRIRATKLLTNEELQLHDCTEGRLTENTATASLGWVVPDVGLTAFVDDSGVCDVAVANGATVLCGGGPERFPGDPTKLETSGGQLQVCAHSGTNLAFLSVVLPENAAWLAVRQSSGWDVYRVGDRKLVRIMSSEARTAGDLQLTGKVFDASGGVVVEKTLTGAVAG